MPDGSIKLPDELPDTIRGVLRQWHHGEQPLSPLQNLYIYRKLCRDRKLEGRLATNELLLFGIEKLQEKDEAAAKLLHNRYLDGMTVAQASHQRNVAESTIFVLQRQASDQLAEVIWQEELTTYAEQQAVMFSNCKFKIKRWEEGVQG